MRLATPESYGNADAVETLEIQKQDSQRSHSVLEISRRQRDSHISTAPTVCYRVSTEQPQLKNWVRWKSGNPKAGFPLSHRTDGLRRKEEIPKSVYDAPGTMCIPCAGLNRHSCRRRACSLQSSSEMHGRCAHNKSPLECSGNKNYMTLRGSACATLAAPP